MASEEEYAKLVALGLLKTAKRAAVDARDLLLSIEDPRGERLEKAAATLMQIEMELLDEAAEGSDRDGS